jgi:hypothetical protein
VVTQQQRARTTNYVEETIQKYLEANEFAPALLFTSNLVHKRLKTLLALRLTRNGDDWREIHRRLDIGFTVAVNLCELLGFVGGNTPKELKRLWKRRNQVAHETNSWKAMSETKKDETRRLCKSAISFLRMTDDEGTSKKSSAA